MSVPAQAQSASDYTAAGFRIIREATIPGPFTGCAKDLNYNFSDGSFFTCSNHRTAFELNPRVQVLSSPDRQTIAVVIGGVAYAGSLQIAHGAVRSSPIVASDEPVGAAALPAGPETQPVKPIAQTDVVEAVKPVQSITELRAQEVQTYRVVPGTTLISPLPPGAQPIIPPVSATLRAVE